MPDERLLAAMNDPESFLRYLNDRLVEAVGQAIDRVNDEEDTRAIFGIPVVVSDLIPPGDIWTVQPPQSPGELPGVVRLRGVAIDEYEASNCWQCGANDNRICWCHETVADPGGRGACQCPDDTRFIRA